MKMKPEAIPPRRTYRIRYHIEDGQGGWAIMDVEQEGRTPDDAWARLCGRCWCETPLRRISVEVA